MELRNLHCFAPIDTIELGVEDELRALSAFVRLTRKNLPTGLDGPILRVFEKKRVNSKDKFKN